MQVCEDDFRIRVDDHEYVIAAAFIDGRDILAQAGLSPASDYTIVQIVGGGSQVIGLDEKVQLNSKIPPLFKVFEGDRIYRALLNEREIVWGAPVISAIDLRSIGDIPMDQDLFLDSDRDKEIDDDDNVRLGRDGVERIRSGKPRDDTVEIVLNGELVQVDKGRLSFSDLAQLAFPELFGRPQICVTISFSRGPRRRREGILLEGDKVRIIKGMVFCVSATDKS